MGDLVRRGGWARRTVLVALVGLLVGLGAPPPAEAARDGGDGTPVEASPGRGPSSEVMDVRVLLYDLLNLADPEQGYVDFLNLIFYVEPTGPIPKLIESMQTDQRGRGAVVDDLFGAVLRRDADPASRAFFIGRLARTGRQKVMADLLASDEYIGRRADWRYPAWIDALYRDALGGPADAAGRQYFLDQLASGRTRGSVASFFTGGAEGRRALARRLLTELLRRPADAAGITYFAGRLAAGTSVERVIAMITSSAEYAITSRAAPAPAVDVVVLLAGNQLRYQQLPDDLGFDPPRVLVVSGLPAGDELVAVDIRPATGTIAGVTDGGQLVTITPGGDATPVGAPLAGFDATGGVGLDVHPELDVAEVVAGSTSHRVDLGTGAATTVPVAYPLGDRHQGETPDLVAGTYVGGTRYAIDAAADALVTRAPAGTLATVGALHADVTAVAGLDTSPDAPHQAYALLDLPEAGPSYWRIDLATGQPRLLDEKIFEEEALDLAVIGSPTEAGDEAAYGITPGATPQLRRLSTQDPEPAESWSVVGITPGTDVVGLDVRPATGDLYGIGSDGQVYAFAFGPDAATVTATALGAPLPGIGPADGIGFDVDPARDALRVVDGHRSRRVRLADGVVEHDEDVVFHLAPGVPEIAGSAFTGSERGAPAPPWDPEQAGRRGLFHLEPADGGRLLWEQPAYEDEVSDLGPVFPGGGSIDRVVGFDISGSLRHTAFALLERDGRQAITTIDLGTGEARHVVDLTPTPQVVYSAFALA